MSDFLMDDEGDWVAENGVLVFLDGRDSQSVAREILQRDTQVLNVQFGEWYRDVTIGIPYVEVIFQKGTELQEVDAILRSALLSVPGTYRLNSFNTNRNLVSRNLTVTYEKQVPSIDENLENSISFIPRPNP